MCEHCEGELETRYEDDYGYNGIRVRSYLSRYESGDWELTISDGDSILTTGVDNCPWCGRALD